VPLRRTVSTRRVGNTAGVALIVIFLIWVFVALSSALRAALTVFLVGDLLVVVSLQVATFVRRPLSDVFRSSLADDPELMARRHRLDPSRPAVAGYVGMAVLLFAVPVVILLGTASSEDAGSPLAETLTGSSLRGFLLLGLSVIILGTCVWIALSGSLGRMHPWAGQALWSTRQAAPLTSPGRPMPEADGDAPATPAGGDALSLVDSAALATVLVGRLGGALGSEFDLTASPEGSIFVTHSGREYVVTSRIGRFRLEPAPRAVALASQQVLSEIQRFATEVLDRPWPARPETGDLRLLPLSPALSRATEAEGLVHLSWQDAFGTVIALEPFALEDVLVGRNPALS
jgi:hypothetical protein